MGLDGLKGKVAVVTGASAGIGAAIAVALVKHGLTVVGVARRQEKVQNLQNDVEGASGKLIARKCDVSVEGDILQLFEWLKDSFGTIQVLINNAGVTRYGKLKDQNPRHWRDILDTNVMGVAVASQQALKLMKESGVEDGHIININSVLGQIVPTMPNPMTGMYTPSKHALTALTDVLRQELIAESSKIRITSISPGVVATEIGEASNAALDESERIDRTKLFSGSNFQPLQPEDLADAVVYVLGTPTRVNVNELTIRPVGQLA